MEAGGTCNDHCALSVLKCFDMDVLPLKLMCFTCLGIQNVLDLVNAKIFTSARIEIMIIYLY
jgi:hypothetical protein